MRLFNVEVLCTGVAITLDAARRAAQWVGTTSRGPTGGRVLEGVFKLPLSPPQARKFWQYVDYK